MKESTPNGLPKRNPDQNKDTVFFSPAKILDGKGAKSLLESMKKFRLPGGENIVAGTDMGIEYKDHNEDRVVVNPAANFVAVIDGMGGEEGNGDLAAQILAESFMSSPQDIDAARVEAITRMWDKGIRHGGAVFVSVELQKDEEGKFLNFRQSGDAKMIVIRTGEVLFQSQEESWAQHLFQQGVISSDETIYHHSRNTPLSAVSPSQREFRLRDGEKIRVQEGDIVLLMSDGISDNFTAEEIAEKARSLSAQELFKWVDGATERRMKMKDQIMGKRTPDNKKSEEQKRILEQRKIDGVFSDGYKSAAKKDNRALVILEIK